eukprot:301872_1
MAQETETTTTIDNDNNEPVDTESTNENKDTSNQTNPKLSQENIDTTVLKDKEYIYYTDDKERNVCNITADALVKKIIVASNESGERVSQHILGRVWINIKGQTANGTVFTNELFEEVSLILGKAEQSKGIDQALVSMKHGEHAIIEIYDVEKYGYSVNQSPLKCPITNENKYDLPLRYELIVMDSLPKQKQSHEMTFSEQLNYSNVLRERGNIRYVKKRFKTALSFYDRAVQCLDAMDDVDMDMPDELNNEKVDKDQVEQCQLKCYLNCAICYRQMKDNDECIKWTNKALEINDTNKKALIRRALSYLDNGNYNKSKLDMIKFQKLATGNKEKKLIKSLLGKIKMAKQRDLEKERQIYGGFLDKKRMSLYDDKKINKNEEDTFLWKMIMVVPNGIMYAFNQCTKYCRKNKND